MADVADKGKNRTGDMQEAHDVGAGLGLMMLMWSAVTIVFGGPGYATTGRKIIKTIQQHWSRCYLRS